MSFSPSTRVLYVTPAVSARPRDGGVLRSTRLVSALGSAPGVTVEALVLPPLAVPPPTAREIGVDAVHVFARPTGRVRTRAVAIARRWPLRWARLWNEGAATLVRERAAAGWTVVLDQFWTAQYLPPGATGRVVLSWQNHESRVLRQLDNEMDDDRGARAIQRRREIEMYERHERRLVRSGLALVLVSDDDAASLAAPHAIVVPNGADVPASPPAAAPDDGPVLFVGSLDYEPNAAAVRWWSEVVWPVVAGRAPPLRVVGRSPHGRLTLPGIDHVGEVDDVGRELAGATVVVAPLLHGGGTRLKVLEALAWQRAVVGTTKAFEGLPLVDGHEVLVRDDATGFAEAVVALRADAATRSRLATAGRAFAERYDWRGIGEQFVAVVTGAR